MPEQAIIPEYLAFPTINYTRNRWHLRVLSLVLKAMRFNYRWAEDIQPRYHRIEGKDGNTIKVIEVAPRTLGDNAPAVVYLHGGAFFLTYAGSHLDIAQRYAREGQCRVFLVDYRLSTEAPFPAAQEDCQSALEWVHDYAALLGVNKDRIVIAGDSAGGCLAASCTHMTQDRNRDRKDPIKLLAQLLVYPATDCETKTESAQHFHDTPLWRHRDNIVMWDVYLRGSDYKKGVVGAVIPEYASPAHRKDLRGLPPAYIEPAEHDPLRDEACDYAKALQQAGVEVQVFETKGAVHGFDAIDCELTRQYLDKRIAVLQQLLAQ